MGEVCQWEGVPELKRGCVDAGPCRKVHPHPPQALRYLCLGTSCGGWCPEVGGKLPVECSVREGP